MSCYNRHEPARRIARSPIFITDLSLVNFRNYENLVLKLEPGMVLIQGDNGQGKSNLLEAIYILAIAKSSSASADRELVRWQSSNEETYSQISAAVQRGTETTRVQVDFRRLPVDGQMDEGHGDHQAGRAGREEASVQKFIKVNGVSRRASQLVGVVNAVMFSAENLELIYGPPPIRRRYLDILISQLDHSYLRALQQYQRVVFQRNHLLKLVRDGSARQDEIEFWDDALVSDGKYLMMQRLITVQRLSELAGRVYSELTNNSEELNMCYRPSIPASVDSPEDVLAQGIRDALQAQRAREIAQGFTATGPHRDDLQLQIDGMDAATYASRGQSRTVALAMKLAEAAYLMELRRQEPILLLDDVLSELDGSRRAHILDRASEYQQCFITTADAGSVEQRFLPRMQKFTVRRGVVERPIDQRDSDAR